MDTGHRAPEACRRDAQSVALRRRDRSATVRFIRIRRKDAARCSLRFSLPGTTWQSRRGARALSLFASIRPSPF